MGLSESLENSWFDLTLIVVGIVGVVLLPQIGILHFSHLFPGAVDKHQGNGAPSGDLQ